MENPKSNIRNPKSYAIIVAGGSGTRMQAIVPKQFLLLNGKPVLMYTVEAFRASSYQPEIIVVMHPNFHTYWKELCDTHNFNIPHRLTDGGETRFQSVKNGLALVNDDSLVAVQDAVRPLTSVEIIDNAYKQANEYSNAIVAVKSRDSVRSLRNGKSESLLRDEIYLVQTPQTFKANLLKKAYLQPFNNGFTDDASVAEADGNVIHLVEGNYQNIKITFPEDIAIAEMLLKMRQ
ncbi:2-C-methyl-D-erythritol 4-phosphate cytidylyltransferase [Mucilaginibacter boryungensis]|uniref:2-C-methyl-D-erythritol 4-phosphate cytidylyltransferase n=1 Tax=Mucilaginibacter boryungensis TaxID=768480 RepID=A0ABR9XEM7_9SPHI|nr:2-C-methyl-D-erythritol 4-phosphate cytidylyltransferase [Mucilaginibacter boryungensis]MBE9665647.1 2-C-methyl-D-erythritol 4-phosphate cytidylyltransferase [Mucilaginibacter boryungensis]